ncbi:MAG: MFS transporter [Oscillospiraceae bacterium]
MGKAKSLTLRYSLQQMAYWAVYAGPVSFAATYLLDKGFRASQVGVVLACANFFSCLLQPLLANFADRARRPILPRLLSALAALSFCCFGAILLFSPPLPLFALFYLVGVLAFDVMVPLLNSLSVYYTLRGMPVNYGVGRAVGSLAFSAAALGVGYLMELAGPDWMPRLVMALLFLFTVITLGYPRAEEPPAMVKEQEKQESCSLSVFFVRYKWFNLSLLGLLFLAMFHAMTENYLIEIVRRLGGDSGSVGTALFVATLAEVPVLLFFDRIHRRLSSRIILLTAGAMFTLKALLFLAAGSVAHIYLIELLQALTYAFVSPVQMYFARERIAPADMVKGQSMATASYALGCASGNLIGGQLIGSRGVTVMLCAGVAMAALGTLILFLTLRHKDAVDE